MSEPVVMVNRVDQVMVVTLNRPEVRNAVNEEVARRLGEALEAADHDRTVRAIVVTGAGGRSFCAGVDLKAVARGERLTPREHAGWGFAGYVSHYISKPTIAAVNGAALGGGTEIALASDIVVAAETAVFGLPEVTHGLFAGAGGAFRLPAQIPEKIALEMIYTGEAIDAARALQLGLVNRVVSAEKVLDEAIALACRIAKNAPLSVQASKRLAKGIIDGASRAEAQAWEQTTMELRALMRSVDSKEGPRAFAEKREPVWRAE